MKRITKIVCLLLLLAIIPFLTGCSNGSSSAKGVAIEMVTRLSKNDYKNIGSIFYQEDSYFDEAAFKSLVKSKGLNISGNKKINVKEVGREITDTKTGNVKVTVKIEIDNNKTFNVDTMKVGNKWYVYDPDFYDGNIEIVVPSNTVVKFNGKVLSSKSAETEEADVKVYYPDTYKYVKLEKVKMDTYTIKNVIKGEYAIAISSKDSKEVKDVVYTYSEYGKTSGNYSKDTEYSSHTKKYTFSATGSNSDVESYVKGYLDNIYKTATTGTFDDVAKYFDKDSKEYNSIKSSYDTLAKKSKSEGNSYYYGDYDVKDLEIKSVGYYDDNHIIVMLSYNLSYKINYTSSSYDKKYDAKSILVLKKDSKEKYVITDGNNIFVK